MPHTQELTKPSVKPKKSQAATQNKTKAVAKASTKTSKTAGKALSTCPVNGAGWCPYPFSVEQLERRLKEKAAAAAAKQKP